MEVHLSFRLLEGYLYFHKLFEESFNVHELLILPSTDVPSLLLFPEGEELFIWNLEQNVHRCICHTIHPSTFASLI